MERGLTALIVAFNSVGRVFGVFEFVAAHDDS